MQVIPIEKLKRCPIQLRPVRKETLAFAMLKDSIRDQGILCSLLVRPTEDGMYEVVDGNNRFEAAKDIGIPGVLCNIRELTDQQVRTLQVVCNSTNIETTTVEYARRLWKILRVEQSMTIPELAHALRKHPDWVKRILNLVNLSAKAEKYLTEGRISATIAIELGKLPMGEQDQLLEVVDSYKSGAFRELVIERAREGRASEKAKRVDRKLQANYRFRALREVRDEVISPVVAASVLSKEEATTAFEGWMAALKWVLRVDPDSILKDQRELERQEQEREKKIQESLSERTDNG